MLRYCFFGLLTFLFSAVLVAADVQKDFAQADFMRVSKLEGRKISVSFDTAIAKFVDKKNNIQVDLVGAVHIGDKEYYAELNEIFKRYDAVLYELVAEEGAKPNIGTGKNESQSALSTFQSLVARVMVLDFQLPEIDYHAKNMVHADMNPTDFLQRIRERGDFIQMLQRFMMLSAQKSTDAEAQKDEMKMMGQFLSILFVSAPSRKRIVAEAMMDQLEDAMWLIGGDSSAIITDRNAAALKVLSREINNGKKKIAIFYGSAHLPEFAKCLEKDFGMKHTETNWVIAWDLTKDRSARKQ